MGARIYTNTQLSITVRLSGGTFITIQCPIQSALVSIVTSTHTHYRTAPPYRRKWTHTHRLSHRCTHTQTHSGQLSDVESVYFSSACVKVSHLSFHSFITPCKGKHYLSLPQPLQMEGEMRYTVDRK